MSAEATADERATVDGLLGPRPGRTASGARDRSLDHVAHGGFHEAQRLRTLLLPAILAVQGEIGYVGEGALNYICERLSVPPAEAYGVATFYALVATSERPPVVVHVCDDIVCRRRGGLDVLASHNGRDDVVASPCLGQCDAAPAVFVQRAGRDDVVVTATTGPPVDAVVAAALDGRLVVDPPPARPSRPGRLLRRVGVVDPGSLDDYLRTGGYLALRRAIEMGPEGVVGEVKASGLRGRGGAAFPTGVKWEAVASADEAKRYVVCNADEAEPGTFKDRVVLEGDPFAVVESLTIAGLAVGATKGYVYIRGEYPLGRRRLAEAVTAARAAGHLGPSVMGTGVTFDIEMRSGGGAYICGEETALFNSIEGFRGEPRQKPPFPTVAGLFGRPTVVNNVETLINVPGIVLEGGDAFARIGAGASTGTKLFCLSGDVARPGVYEVDFGATVADLLEMAGADPADLGAVLLGGAAGSFIGPDRFDLPLTFEATGAAGVSLGSGVVMALKAGTDFVDLVRRIAAFFRDESCGQCVPCRVGTVRQEEALHRITVRPDGAAIAGDRDLLAEIDAVMRSASICGLGHTAGSAAQSALRLGLLGVSP